MELRILTMRPSVVFPDVMQDRKRYGRPNWFGQELSKISFFYYLLTMILYELWNIYPVGSQ